MRPASRICFCSVECIIGRFTRAECGFASTGNNRSCSLPLGAGRSLRCRRKGAGPGFWNIRNQEMIREGDQAPIQGRNKEGRNKGVPCRLISDAPPGSDPAILKARPGGNATKTSPGRLRPEPGKRWIRVEGGVPPLLTSHFDPSLTAPGTQTVEDPERNPPNATSTCTGRARNRSSARRHLQPGGKGRGKTATCSHPYESAAGEHHRSYPCRNLGMETKWWKCRLGQTLGNYAGKRARRGEGK